MEAHRDGLLQLPDSRVRMEAEALFGYGSAAASLQLLWRHRLLDVLLPRLAERFAKAKLPRCAAVLYFVSCSVFCEQTDQASHLYALSVF